MQTDSIWNYLFRFSFKLDEIFSIVKPGIDSKIIISELKNYINKIVE
jgi:nucleosome binding factor SPN SPT16 subunit